VIFHNIHAASDREIFPSWHITRPAMDDEGSKAWVDDELNVLVFVVRHRVPSEEVVESDEGGGFYPRRALFVLGGNEVSVDSSDHDSIVVISESGMATRFSGCLGSGDAARIHKQLVHAPIHETLADCAARLGLLEAGVIDALRR
jgi:hypothetical protein